MSENEIINKAIQELKSAEKPYIMLKNFTFLSGMEWEEDTFQKIRYLLIKSTPFEKHGDYAIKFSEIGVEIATNHKDWFSYKKSLKPKIDYIKWVGVGFAGLSLIWNIYQGITNRNLEDKNRILLNQIELLKKEIKELGKQPKK